MSITEDQILNWYEEADYAKGLDFYRQHRVRNYHDEESASRTFIMCTVRDTEDYSVSFYYANGRVVDDCSCARFAATGSCQHITAALIEYSNRKKTVRAEKSDWRAQRLISAYLPGSRGHSATVSLKKATLQPVLKGPYESGAYPYIAFKVGYDRLYVVRNIRDFLDRMESGTVFSYGKNLNLRHNINEFDDTSRQLIAILQDNLQVYRTVYSNYLTYYGDCNIKGEIQLTGSSFDRFFDLYTGTAVSYDTGGYMRLMEGDPDLTLRVSPQGNRTLLEFEALSELYCFGSGDSLYVCQGQTIRRCTDGFRSSMRPLLERAGDSMCFIREDLQTFCSCVLPQIRSYITIEDSQELLAESSPDECMPCFYFDIDNDILTCRLTFRYGDFELPSGSTLPAGSTLKRSLLVEQLALEQLQQYFTTDPVTGRFELSGDDEIFDFLSNVLEGFRAHGELYVSDRLRGMEVHPVAPSVGISVSDGLLHLELDTGGFPVEELEALYQSMLKRRRYHRLTDGRYLVLGGSPLEAVAEAAHMSQLSNAGLEKGTVTMPAFRGLYLNDVLGNSEGLSVTRDSSFRDMIRKFKTVSDSDYSVPESFNGILRPYQKTGFRWLKTLESCGFGGILADEMGLGKTLQLITFFATVPNSLTGMPNLVVCPASLVLNWAEELQRFAPDLKVLSVLGTATQRRELIAGGDGYDLWITSYDLLKRDLQQYSSHRFYCCALDEGQYIKNQTTQASKAVKSIRCSQRFVLTGTPIENRLSELWNLFDFLMPGYLFSHNRFLEKLERPIVKAMDEQAQQSLQKLVHPFMLRRLKQDVLKELPPKLEYIRKVGLSENERKVYHASVLAAKTKISDSTEKLQILAALTRLRQICCDPALCYENYDAETSKLDACLELITSMTENGHQLLVFSQFTSMLEILRQRLLEAQISCFLLQGSTSKERRAQLVRSFNAGMAQVFLISLKAGGTGLNLTAADVVIHYDPWWNLAAQNQATDRAHRIGQKSCVQVYKLITAGTIEEKIIELQERKAQLMDSLETGSDSILSMNREDLLALLD